jgi:hypothetical protein
MITFIELIALLTFIGMGAYIIYLQQQLKDMHKTFGFMTMAMRDIADGKVSIENTPNGIRIYMKGQQNGDSKIQ